LGDLLRQLAADSSTLIREEFALVRQEAKQALRGLATNASLVAAGAVLALLALGTLTAAAVIGLGRNVGYGTSALIVGAILTAIAGGAIAWGVQRMRATPIEPEKTLESLEDWRKGSHGSTT
jgi:hypothetical protein